MSAGDDARIRGFLQKGAELCGGGVGGASGSLALLALDGGATVAGVAAAGLVSGVVRTGVTRVITDVATRLLSSRENQRVAIATHRTLNRIWERVQKEEVRDDGFFDQGSSNNDQSPAEQLFEGVLLKCKSEHEEKKNQFVENLFVNTAFRADISTAAAISLLNIVSGLTYRQFCVLSLLAQSDRFHIELDTFLERERNFFPTESHAVLLKHEINDLVRLGMFDPRRSSSSGRLSSLGRLTVDLLDLRDIEESDLISVRSVLPP